MKKRQLILNDYRTAEDGLFTLSACKITKATQEQTFVKVPGRFAPLDLSTVLTDGQPYYGNAKLDAVLESSEGTRAERQERIERLKNLLDGQIAKIVHPDFPGRYMVGRVEVIPDFNGLAYCSVALSAVLEPWLYNEEETEAVTTLPHYEPYENLIHFPYTSTTQTVNGVTFTVNRDGTITVNGTATDYVFFMLGLPNVDRGTYFISGNPSIATTETIQMYAVVNGGYYWGNVAFSVNERTAVDVNIRCSPGTTLNNVVFKPMLNEGDTAKPFKPAKNIWDEQWFNGYLNEKTGEYIEDAARGVCSKNFIPVIPNETYSLDMWCWLSFYDKNYNFVSAFEHCKNYIGASFTVPSNACFMKFQGISEIYGIVYNNDIIIHPGKAAAPYVPYVNTGGTNLFRAELGGDGYFASGYYDELEVIGANTIVGIPKAGQGSDFIRFAQKYPPGVYTLRNKGRDPRQMFWLFDADGNNISAQHQSSFGVPYNSYYDGFYSPGEELIVTIPNSVAFWRYGVFFQPDGNNRVTLSEIQVSRGEGTPYEPTYPLGDERLTLTNEGKLAVAPVVEVEGEVTLTIGNTSRAMSTGSYLLPELYLTPGEHVVQCSGTGTAKITYREAVLAG